VPSIKWGIKHEKAALKSYERIMGVRTNSCGLFPHKEWDFFGATPDALSADDKTVIEIKCPDSTRLEKPTKCSYVDPKGSKLVHKKYYAQV